MREMIQMVVVLVVLSSISGGLLAGIRKSTEVRVENQILEFEKAPAIRGILSEVSNDPVADRFKLMDGETERSFFVGVVDGRPSVVVIESSGKGYGGDVGLIVGIDVEADKIFGMGVTTHSETPGLGARAKSDPGFVAQFKDLSSLEPLQVSGDGGQISAMSGATITSRAVCAAATEAGTIYQRLKPQLVEKMKAFAK